MTLPCLILAAGFGNRMGDLTATQPKPLIEVGGNTLLDHALHIARDAAGPIAVNAHYRADQISAHLGPAPDVTLLHETPHILDSGGAVKNAARRWRRGPMATLNADNVWTGPNSLNALSAAFDASRMDALLLLIPRIKATGREGGGDFEMDADGRLELKKSPDALVYTGAQILDPTLALQDPRDVFSLRDVWAAMQANGRLFGLIHEGGWADVGQPQGILDAEAMLAEAPDA